MKIGILTLPLHTNYGGILQAYALQTILKDMGHDVKVIDGGIHNVPIWKMIIRYVKQIIKCSKNIKNEQIYGFQIRKFVKQNIDLLPSKYCFTNDTFDAIIVGSDQVWRQAYTENIEYYFLDFAKEWNIKRIAYAASFGIDFWDYSVEKTELCKELLSLFNYVSVREESGIRLCKEYFNTEATMMLDPTLLLTTEYYRAIGKKNKVKIKGKLLSYILDATEEKYKVLNSMKEAYNVDSYSLNTQSSLFNQYPTIEYWIDGFSKAEYVFTDSFHGCVFSLIFNVPFIVYGNKERGMARFTSLLKLINLEDRLIFNIEDLPKTMFKPINWKSVNEILTSYQYLAKKTFEECLKI